MLVGEQVLGRQDKGRVGAEQRSQLRELLRVGGRAHRAVDQRQQAAAGGKAAERDCQVRPQKRVVTCPRSQGPSSPSRDHAPEPTQPNRGFATEQRPGGDQHRQRRGEHDRLRLLVRRAGEVRVGKKGSGHGERRRNRALTTMQPPDKPVSKRGQPQQATQVVEEDRCRPVAWVEAEVARRPDAERLQRRDSVEEIAEPGARRVESLKAREVDHPADLRCGGYHEGGDRDDRRGRRPPDERHRVGGRAASCGQPELHERPQAGGARQPQQPGKAIGVDGADRQPGERDRGEGVPRPDSVVRSRDQRPPRQLVQSDREGKHEQCFHGLLEGALNQVRGRHVRQADQQRAEDAPPLGERRQKDERRQRRHHGDRESEAVEAVDEAAAGPLRCGHDQGVGTERVALTEELPALAVSELVGGVEMLRHVRVEAGAEDPKAPLDEERERRGE